MKSKIINILKKNYSVYRLISFCKGVIFDFKYWKLSLKWNLESNFLIDITTFHNSNVDKNLNVVWCGINENQDRSGLIQGLDKIFKLDIFYRPNNEYGLINSSIYNLDSIDENGELLYNYLKMRLETDQIDYLIGQFMGFNINNYWLERIQNLEIKIISLSWDDKLENLWNKDYKLSCHSISKNINYVLCSSLEPLKAYVNSNPIFFPLGSYDEVFCGDPFSNKTIDVLFIGNQYGARKNHIDFLIKNKINVEFYGRDWGTKFLSFKECAQKFKQAKIILGIGYVSHSTKITTLKLRDFDASISGALYLTTENEELKKLFPNNEIEYYKSKRELLKKIKFYLRNDNLRTERAAELQKFTVNNYSWDILFKKLNSLLNK